jgi:hypothetical protein
MKHSGFSVVLYVLAVSAFGQRVQNTLALTVSENDRISVVRSSVRLAEWHEKSFWPIYDKYLTDAVKGYSSTYRSLQDLAATDKTVTAADAYENGRKFLNYRTEELALRKQYYHEVAAALNGVVALQFLQTEAMMDMIETSDIYGKSSLKNYKFHPQSMASEAGATAKHNIMATALALSDSEKEAFWTVYDRYEEECNAVLGENYSLYSLFASDAADFTPALAKRLGNDLLQVMEREQKLKEKYYNQMNTAAGSYNADRFLAWEDYYSVVAKMYAWADTP